MTCPKCGIEAIDAARLMITRARYSDLAHRHACGHEWDDHPDRRPSQDADIPTPPVCGGRGLEVCTMCALVLGANEIPQHKTEHAEFRMTLGEMFERLGEMVQKVDAQAEDRALWFGADIERVRDALRELHTAIEGWSPKTLGEAVQQAIANMKPAPVAEDELTLRCT